MASEELMERLIEAERRAAAAEALLARYQERERLDNEARAKRRQDAADRKRKSRAGHTQSQNVTVTSRDNAGHCVTPPSPLSPQVSSSSPTPLITTSFPPISPPPGLAGADAPSPASISPPEPKTPGRRSRSAAKYPAFPDEDCGLLWAAWNQTFGGVDYAVFRKALGSFYQAAQTPPSVEQVTDAIKAYREAVDEMDEREAGWQSIHKFAQRLDHWLKIGAMPYSTEWGVLTERGRVLGSKAMREQARGARVA